MAKELGGIVHVHLTVRVAWWVGPYMFLVKVFLFSIVPFVEDDDERLEIFINRSAQFVGNHGIRYYANGKRL